MKPEEINEVFEVLNSIDINVGGCAVLHEKTEDRGHKYYLIEHPLEKLYLVNGHLFYECGNPGYDKMELLFKHKFV